MNVQDLNTKIADIVQYLKIHESSSKVEETVPFAIQRQKELLFLLESLKEFLKKYDLDTALNIVPDTGQLLGRLYGLKTVICDETLFKSLFTCLLCLYKQNPSTQLEKKAKQWVLAQIRYSCLMERQDFVVCKLGLDRSAVIDEQLNLLLKHVSIGLEKAHSNIMANYAAHGRSQQSLSVDSALKSVITTLLSVPYLDTLSIVWEKLLDILSNYSNHDPSVLLVYQRLMEIQKQSYSSKEYPGVSPELSKKCCYLLWTNYLPSLEQAVLLIIQEAKKFTLPSNMEECLKRQHLISICAEHSHIHMTVMQMLHTLFMMGNGSPVVAGIISSLNMLIQNYINDNNDPSKSLCTRYPTGVQSLVSQLMLNHRDLTVDQTGYHITHITECIKNLSSHHVNKLSPLFLLHFQHWYMKAVQMCLVCDKKHVSGCLELISYFYNNTQTIQREEHYERLQNLIKCLRPLLLKTSLRLNDIRYALEVSHLDGKDGEMDAVFGQVLVSFIFHSTGGVTLTAEILEMVTGKSEPFENLSALMIAHEYLGIDFSQWPVNKLQDYSTVIDSLLSSVNNTVGEQMENSVKINEIVGAASEFLMSAKQLIRQKDRTCR